MAVKIGPRAKMWIQMAGLPLNMAASVLSGLDENEEGADDLAAVVIHYTTGCLTALANGQPFPPVPQELVDTTGTTAAPVAQA